MPLFWSWFKIESVQPYLCFLQGYLKQHKIKSVLDVGCGTWEFSKMIDWDGIDYLGVDVVPFLIEKNKKLYGNKNISFRALDFTKEDLPNADVLICKDVLQHLPNEDTALFLNKAKKFPRVIVTNDIPLDEHSQNIYRGGHRGIDLELPPYSTKGTTFFYPLIKKVLFWENNLDHHTS